MANLIIKTSGSYTKQNIQDAIAFGDKSSANSFLRNIARALHGNSSCELQILNNDAVSATGTFTFSGAASANDTILINGITFTAKSSGATGNQWNVGADQNATAQNLSNAINSSSTALISGSVSASAASGVVTISATPGASGNFMTIAKGVDGGSVNTVSGARLTGGANDTGVSKSFMGY